MAKTVNLSSAIELVTAVAVVVSRIYVARKIQQNTAAIQAAASRWRTSTGPIRETPIPNPS